MNMKVAMAIYFPLWSAIFFQEILTVSCFQILPTQMVVTRVDRSYGRNIHKRAFAYPLFLAQQQVPKERTDEVVEVGSKEYFAGMLERGIEGEPVERVSGDKILGPTFKFVGGFAIALLALFLGFMSANGLF